AARAGRGRGCGADRQRLRERGAERAADGIRRRSAEAARYLARRERGVSRAELASMLRRFVGDEPDCGEWEWDDFISLRAEPEIEPYRQRLLKDVHPHLGKKEKADEIDAILRETIAELEPST